MADTVRHGTDGNHEVVRSMRDDQQFFEELLSALAQIRLLPMRCLLQVEAKGVTLPMLRGVWGAALHDLDADAYRVVFDPKAQGGRDEPIPLYLMRPAPKEGDFWPAFEWALIGEALRYQESCRRAWDVAAGRGIGRNREPFFMRRVVGLAPDGTLHDSPTAWSLDQAIQAAPSSVRAGSPLKIDFRLPTRLIYRKKLVKEPLLMDVIVAATRRLSLLLPPDRREEYLPILLRAREKARALAPGVFYGDRRDVRRYSGRQRREVDLYGVVGWLELPEGAGPLWPLLWAAQWIHIGKGTVLGMGQVAVTPIAS